jgi:hypothetical protein
MDHISTTRSDNGGMVLIYRCPEHGLWCLMPDAAGFRPVPKQPDDSLFGTTSI